MKTFNHKPVDLPILEQLNLEEGRRYQVGSKRYPSVTTVLGDTADKRGLHAWRKRVGEEEANRVSAMATRRGTFFHSLCESYLSNEECDQDHPDSLMMFRSMIPTLNRMDNIRVLEKTLYSNALEVAGTVDCVAEIDGKLSVIDFKTSNRPKSRSQITDYFMQGCFYFASYYERTQELPEQVAILIAVADGTTQEFTINGSEIIHYTKLLQDRIGIWYSQKR